MRRPNLWWILLGIAVLAVPACSDSDIDEGDSANVLLQILEIDNPAVQGTVQVGTCSVTGASCLDNSDCDPLDPTDVCDLVTGECVITEWTATLQNAPKTDLAVETPFNDIVVQDITVSYSWETGFAMTPITFPLGLTIPANTSKAITFFPLSGEDLGALLASLPTPAAVTADLTITFRGELEDGVKISRTAGAQLFVEACN